MSLKPSDLAEDMLADLADRVADRLVKERLLDEEAALALAEDLTLSMAEAWGGQLMYFAKGHHSLVSRRDRDLYAAFDGSNHAELVRLFGVGLQHVYKVVKRMRKWELKQRQAELFCEEM